MKRHPRDQSDRAGAERGDQRCTAIGSVGLGVVDPCASHVLDDHRMDYRRGRGICSGTVASSTGMQSAVHDEPGSGAGP